MKRTRQAPSGAHQPAPAGAKGVPGMELPFERILRAAHSTTVDPDIRAADEAFRRRRWGTACSLFQRSCFRHGNKPAAAMAAKMLSAGKYSEYGIDDPGTALDMWHQALLRTPG